MSVSLARGRRICTSVMCEPDNSRLQYKTGIVDKGEYTYSATIGSTGLNTYLRAEMLVSATSAGLIFSQIWNLPGGDEVAPAMAYVLLRH